jgi:hypothetical protein
VVGSVTGRVIQKPHGGAGRPGSEKNPAEDAGGIGTTTTIGGLLVAVTAAAGSATPRVIPKPLGEAGKAVSVKDPRDPAETAVGIGTTTTTTIGGPLVAVTAAAGSATPRGIPKPPGEAGPTANSTNSLFCQGNMHPFRHVPLTERHDVPDFWIV